MTEEMLLGVSMLIGTGAAPNPLPLSDWLSKLHVTPVEEEESSERPFTYICRYRTGDGDQPSVIMDRMGIRAAIRAAGKTATATELPTALKLQEETWYQAALVEEVRNYFLLKEAEALMDSEAQDLLVRLVDSKQKGKGITYDELNLSTKARALAKLTAAGFCYLGEQDVKISEAGERFLRGVLHSSD